MNNSNKRQRANQLSIITPHHGLADQFSLNHNLHLRFRKDNLDQVDVCNRFIEIITLLKCDIILVQIVKFLVLKERHKKICLLPSYSRLAHYPGLLMLTTLIYRSHIRDAEPVKKIEEMVSIANRRNMRSDVTGILLFNGSHFSSFWKVRKNRFK